ncbi:MAG: hypothetical protein A3E80_03540 [Chlamydiae bacterium RIFCSPHIGHO2_12_FULL_49_9]|nr:MAG: hypothetical protein A3E80_03540 [Chlamydiae bacterium RIFCSPHIGHO2_12_FULL_49_9]
MTKVGEGGNFFEKSPVERSKKDLTVLTEKFQNAIESYDATVASKEEKEHLKAIMDEQLSLIQAAVNEIKKSGMHKQEALLEKHYKSYMLDPSPESFSAIEHDIATLREYINPSFK